MPIEYTLLKDKPAPLEACPKCNDQPFDPFMRGMVQVWWRRTFGMPYCCVICSRCKKIVGYEKP